MSAPNTQLAPAIALVQLLQEHPELSDVADWQVLRDSGELHGHLHNAHATFDTLGAFAHLLGGSIRPTVDIEVGGRKERCHRLTATWRDVTVRLTAYIPLAVSEAFEGALAEQRHQFADPAVPAGYASQATFKAVA